MKRTSLYVLLIIIISVIFSVDLFLYKGQPASFDEATHITNISVFHTGLSQGQFPVTWADGFANYGMPIPLIAQQIPSYAGAFLTFVTHNPVTSYNLVVIISAILSSVFLFMFLKYHMDNEQALLATFLFSVAPYRIINIYIRGALPEFVSNIFLPLLLMGIYYVVARKSAKGFLLTTLSIAGLALTHPFMLIVYSFIYVPYTIFLSMKERVSLKQIGMLVFAAMLGIGLSGYYILPLFGEIKYFYYGLSKTHLVANQYLHLENYLNPNWYYYYNNDTFPRGHFLKIDLPETLIILGGIIYLIYLFLKKKKESQDVLLRTMVVASIFLVLFTFSVADPLYKSIKMLGNIQHPWRMLSGIMYLAPIMLAILVKAKNRALILIIILFFVIIRFPQLYGKNYYQLPQSEYYRTLENLHGTILNTIWTSNTLDYPVKDHKGDIFRGEGKIIASQVQNGKRIYKVSAQSDLQMVDYTFYFPGWHAYIDGVKKDIQFQDTAYRGVITYAVPKGEHEVKVVFEDTKIRMLGKIVTIVSFLITGATYYLFKRQDIV